MKLFVCCLFLQIVGFCWYTIGIISPEINYKIIGFVYGIFRAPVPKANPMPLNKQRKMFIIPAILSGIFLIHIIAFLLKYHF